MSHRDDPKRARLSRVRTSPTELRKMQDSNSKTSVVNYPRCALLPLGRTRGIEGLTVWEFISFQSKADTRYHSGERHLEEEENLQFLWEEEWQEGVEDNLTTHEEDIEEEDWQKWVEDQEANEIYYESLEAGYDCDPSLVSYNRE
jgi:hypothetical protein